MVLQHFGVRQRAVVDGSEEDVASPRYGVVRHGSGTKRLPKHQTHTAHPVAHIDVGLADRRHRVVEVRCYGCCTDSYNEMIGSGADQRDSS